VTVLERSVLRFHPATRARLDELADLASSVLRCDVPRAAVVRAAVCAWLATTASADPAKIIEAIRTSRVKRGKKARGLSP
jgi:N-acetylglucosamine-6-phosphate deacetylase